MEIMEIREKFWGKYLEKFSKTTQAKEKDRTSVKFRVKTTHSSQDYSQPS